MKKIISLLMIVVFIISGCSESSTGDKINVVTTVYPLELMVEQIGGDLVDVESLYPEGSDPHSYEPTAKEMLDIQNADFVFYTSDVEEHFIEDVKSTDNSQGTEYVCVSQFESVVEFLGEDAYGIGHEGEESAILDAHLTIAPNIDMLVAQEIADSINSNFPGNETVIQDNTDNLVMQLKVVDESYKEFADKQLHPIIVTHDAYSHLTEQYEIEFITLYGAHHDDEPSTKQIVEVTDLIEKEGIETIYVEQNDTENKVMNQIASQTNSSIEVLNNMETKLEGEEGSLIDLLNANLEAMNKNAKN